MRREVIENDRYGARHVHGPNRRSLAEAHWQGQFAGISHARRGKDPEEPIKKDRGPHRDDRESRPGQSLFRQPVQFVLRAVGALGDGHLRDGHLRHVYEGFDAVN